MITPGSVLRFPTIKMWSTIVCGPSLMPNVTFRRPASSLAGVDWTSTTTEAYPRFEIADDDLVAIGEERRKVIGRARGAS